MRDRSAWQFLVSIRVTMVPWYRGGRASCLVGLLRLIVLIRLTQWMRDLALKLFLPEISNEESRRCSLRGQ